MNLAVPWEVEQENTYNIFGNEKSVFLDGETYMACKKNICAREN